MDRHLHSPWYVFIATPQTTSAQHFILKAKNLVNSTTAYTYDLRTQTYLQPAFAYQTLQRMHTVNAQLLGQLQMQHDLVLEKQTVPAGTSISDLIQVAIREKSKVHSPIILDAVMKELETQTLSVFLFLQSRTKSV